MTEDQRIAAEFAPKAADAIAVLAEQEPEFASDDQAWSAYQDAQTSLATAYNRTTHSGIGLVSGELLAAALPSLAMRQWRAASELARVGAAYAEVEVGHIERGGERYDYATLPFTLAAISPVDWSAPDLAADVLPDLARDANTIARISRKQWLKTLDAPLQECPNEPDRSAMLEQLADACAGLDGAGSFAPSNRPPVIVLLEAALTSVAQREGATTYPFAAATAVLAEYELNHIGTPRASTSQRADSKSREFTAEETERRRTIVMAMLQERDQLGTMSLDEVLQARDEGRP